MQFSYNQLEEKHRLFEQIQSEYDSLKDKFDQLEIQFQEQQEINSKLKTEYEHQHFHLLDRDENIRLLKIDLDEKKHKLEEFHSSSSKQNQQLSDLLESRTNENQNLIETNRQLQDDLKANNQLLFEKSKQADDLDKQLHIINNEYRDLSTKYAQMENEKDQLTNQMNSLKEELESNRALQSTSNDESQLEALRNENAQLIQKLEVQNTESESKIQVRHLSPFFSSSFLSLHRISKKNSRK